MIDIALKINDGRKKIARGHPTKSPYIGVHQYWDGLIFVKKQWVVTHLPSGASIEKSLLTKNRAVTFANSIKDIVDWSLSFEELQKNTTPEQKRLFSTKLMES